MDPFQNLDSVAILVLKAANVDADSLHTLTRDDLRDLLPGPEHFHRRKAIWEVAHPGPTEDPDTYLQKRPLSCPVLLIDKDCMVAVGTSPVAPFPKSKLHEGVLYLMAFYYVFHMTYPKCISTLLSVLQTEVLQDLIHERDATAPYKKVMAEWKAFIELEAKEACDWLRAAGFPQYAQLYEGALFPIDISSVRKDHGFLDQDSLKSLCRRLTTLNKCAAMRLEVHFQSKQSEDSEEDEVCAISDRWAFQRESKTWSRLRPLSPTLRASASSESVLSDFSDLEVTSVNSATSVTSALSASSLSLDSIAREMTSAAVATSEPSLLPSLEVLRHKEEEEREKESGREKEGGREKAKRSSSRSFLRRMESLRRRDLREKETASAGISTVTQPTALDAMVTVECLHGNRHSRTWDGSLPGLSHTHAPTHTPSTMPGAWKAHTICRTSVDRSEAPLRPPRRSCLYLEDYQLVWDPKPSKHNCRLGKGWEEGRVVRLPSDHKPGTFPRSLSIESLCPTSLSHDSEQTGWPPGEEDPDFSLGGGCNSCSESQDFSPTAFQNRRNSCSSVGSVYDNVPEMEEEEIFNPDGEMDGETNGEMDGESKAFQHLDDILQHVQGLQSNITQWSRSLSLDQPETTLPGSLSLDQPETTLPSSLHETTLPRMQWSRSLRLQDDTEDRSAAETTLPSSLHFEEHSMSDVGTTTASDYDSTGNSLNEGEGGGEMRERRDSGVGASLTRPSRKLRWHSFQNSHRPSATSASQEINRQSAAQLNLLQKFSLLRLTAIMERYCEHSKQGWSWTVPKFMKRSKVAKDYRDKQVFGVPPIIHVQRTGQPLPQSIQQAMRYLRSQCLEKVGIFRKSGVKSRIQALRQLNENSPDHVSYEGQSAYDVADLLKQYFRDLPEPVLTTKLTDTFLQIYQYVPVEQRLRAVQAAVILLPDESREVLQTFLYFLSDIVSAQENQMTAQTLAVCLAPSILHLNACKREGTSPRLISRRGGVKPDHKDLSENMAATQGLSHMITECKKLFQIPHEMMLQSRNSYVAADAQPLPLHGLGVNQLGEPVDYRAYLEDNIQCLLRESAEKSRGWHSAPGPHNTELAYKKVGDGHPIRLWRVVVEIEAPPPVVLQRILRERHLWDEDLLHSRVIESLESCTEVFHYITDSMAPQPRRHCIVLRRWCNDLPKGVCLLVSSSVDHGNVHLEAGLRAVLLTSRFLIEPCGMGRSRLTHYCRADLRGRSPEWYNKVFGHLCAVEAARIRGSFPVLMARGPETKL